MTWTTRVKLEQANAVPNMPGCLLLFKEATGFIDNKT